MTKKRLMFVFDLFIVFILSVGLISCDDGYENNHPTERDNTSWFSEEELKTKGLEGLKAPTGLTGSMKTSIYWFNDGYSFSQVCPSLEVFNNNASEYFKYFKEHYDGLFGTISIEKISMSSNENWYIINQKNDLADYYGNNPSNLYKFYYVTDSTTENGYLKKGAVWIFEIRYEIDLETNEYKFKLFIESADMSHNNVYSNYYKIK